MITALQTGNFLTSRLIKRFAVFAQRYRTRYLKYRSLRLTHGSVFVEEASKMLLLKDTESI